jgi:DNA replication protein DnaC
MTKTSSKRPKSESCRETHILLEELADATLDGTRMQYMESVSTVALLIIDDFGRRKLPQTAAGDLLGIIMRRYEHASTLLTSNRPVEDWGKLPADVAAVSAILDRLLHDGHDVPAENSATLN